MRKLGTAVLAIIEPHNPPRSTTTEQYIVTPFLSLSETMTAVHGNAGDHGVGKGQEKEGTFHLGPNKI
jgi:hypothetical protein